MIHCCGGKRKSKTYRLFPEENYLICEVDYLEECPVCEHTVLQLTRIDLDHKVSVCRRVNEKARSFFEKIKSSIIFEKKISDAKMNSGGAFYLNYNEYGIKKRCYSNLSTLKMGMFENKNYSERKMCVY